MIEMRGRKKIIHSSHVACLPCLIFSLVLLGSTQFVWSVDVDEYAKTGNPAAIPLVTSTIYNQISNLTKLFQKDIKNALGFCIKDVDTDLNGAFKYSNNLDFLTNCVKETTDLSQRLCTAAEMKFYFSTFMDSKSADAQFLKPNNNCNLASWVPGCEPGWASSVDPSAKVDLKNAKVIPDRALESQPCCEGFFCPRGLTCMIPCPLGSFCPRAKLNKATGLCDPYVYRLPHGNPNHTCGGADMWASVGTSEEIFCAAGSYCPTNMKKIQCTKGNYCRMGSISQRACFKLSTCNPNTDQQNLHAVGLLLIGALSFILIIIYNCSDQVLTTRYERMAKSREKAARSARETAQARQRWRVAKDNLAKKRAVGLQQQLSRTFSRKKSAKGAADVEDTLSQSSASNPQAPTTTNLPLPPSANAKSKKKENELTKMMNSFDDDHDNHEGFHFKIGDKNVKKPTTLKNPKLHSRSQIFRYAYGQLEKEKAMEQKNTNLTFSGVISMATDSDIQKRPTIEVAFKDLTITLKKKNIHLMRSVTGKIMPGRISAVMGPSGAGKTTFLSAVMGKITGCHVTGSVLINGKHEPIQSYRKIIGFVPQDDIVHGNLTVEENLRFHARCRLSVDLPKADKVLIVERVIESLGLQPVRESLVGTVERRGISGGQRKRVNVGLEMVMEPSLLILDEPTSGLDSSSSNLLLKALRREAHEGVNISMVVHQPSYALYKMFDDLILLAKGGLIVYHGPVKKVEEYFAGVGITIPERVNPPDHLIDILEGIVKPSANVKPKQLPVRWMLYNGYAVPSDMLECLDEAGASAKPPEHNISADISQDKQDQPTSQLLDISERGTPGIIRQYRYYMGRVIKQRMREAKVQAIDYLILLVAGACLGTLSQVKGDTFGYHGFMYTVIAVSLLCKIAALRSFSLDKLHYWRESGSGMSSLACFLAKDTVDNFNSLIKPLVFLSMFFFFNNPRSTFQENYFILFCLIYCVTGIAYIFAICLGPGPAQLWCVLLPVVLTLIANQGPNDKFGKFLSNYCYPKWALEAFVIANAQRFSGVWLISRCGTMMEYGYNVNNFFRCLGFLLITGIVSRLVAFICLITVAKR